MRSKVAPVAVVLAAAVAIAVLADFGINFNKVHAGVRIGEVDVGGKSAEEAAALIEGTYSGRLAGRTVNVFASEEAANSVEKNLASLHGGSLTEQQSVEEARANKTLWQADASALGARLATDELVRAAMGAGRENPLARLEGMFFGADIAPYAVYDTGLLEAFISDINATIGKERIDWNIAVTEGVAAVTEGQDGALIDHGLFKTSLDAAFLTAGEGQAYFVATAQHAPIRITQADAEALCSQVNAAIAPGAVFVYRDTQFNAGAQDIGSWVGTRIVGEEGGWRLEPFLDPSVAKGALLNQLNTGLSGDVLSVRFDTASGEPLVHAQTDQVIPAAAEAVDALEEALFPDGSEEARPSAGAAVPTIEVAPVPVPGTLTFDEAKEAGIVSPIAEFTTEYTAEPASRQHNIHLASDILNNSVVPGAGGRWSFNGTAGNYNEERGFQGAGAILDNEYVDAVGGGVCQVATTVFNAVYDAGYPVVSRFNHSLYIDSYPEGRDAAVAWPDLDLVWENDTDSDVLLTMHCTDTTVTATLWGVDPEYQVSTRPGEWKEGARYKTKVETDEGMATGAYYVKTSGTDGRKITIVRVVSDKNGTILHEDLFSSSYDPKNEVIVAGPDTVLPPPSDPAR